MITSCMALGLTFLLVSAFIVFLMMGLPQDALRRVQNWEWQALPKFSWSWAPLPAAVAMGIFCALGNVSITIQNQPVTLVKKCAEPNPPSTVVANLQLPTCYRL